MGHLIWLFVVYMKYNPIKDKFYAGMTGGLVENEDIQSAIKLVEKRDKYHHRNKDGFGKADVVNFSAEKDAIRGYEQMSIDKLKDTDKCGNIRNSISPRNPNRAKYLSAALRVFGDTVLTLGVIGYFLF